MSYRKEYSKRKMRLYRNLDLYKMKSAAINECKIKCIVLHFYFLKDNNPKQNNSNMLLYMCVVSYSIGKNKMHADNSQEVGGIGNALL